MNENQAKPGDIVQVTNQDLDAITGLLLIVDEVKSWGVQGSMLIPYKGEAYFRVNHGEYVVVGQAVMVPQGFGEHRG